MSSADGVEARGAPSRLDTVEFGAEQENQHSCNAVLSHYADRPPLRPLPLGKIQHAQRPRPKLPGSLNLTRKLSAPVRKATTVKENAAHAPAEASLPGESSMKAGCTVTQEDPASRMRRMQRRKACHYYLSLPELTRCLNLKSGSIREYIASARDSDIVKPPRCIPHSMPPANTSG